MKTKLIAGIALSIISLGLTIAIFMHFAPISQERIDRATERVDETQFNLIGLCYDLKKTQTQMLDEYGLVSEEFQQFNKQNKDNFDVCQEGLDRIKKTCREQPNLVSCNDSRLG